MAGEPTPDQLELLARQLLSTNERNEQLIEGLLVLAESDRGLAGSSPQRLDELAADVVSYQQQLAELAKVSIAADLAPVLVPGERPLLERLLVNLIQNAVKHNVAGGWVRVVVSGRGTITVSTSGHGVDSAAVPSLFEPFRRLSGDRMNHSSGSGLGPDDRPLDLPGARRHHPRPGQRRRWPGRGGGAAVLTTGSAWPTRPRPRPRAPAPAAWPYVDPRNRPSRRSAG